MTNEPVVAVTAIEHKIFLFRGERVMLDSDLAILYGIATKTLVRAVLRNPARFPVDFLLRLTTEEAANLRYHFGTSSSGHGGRRHLPYAFTEQGVAMLSSVLRSPPAVAVNVEIMRTFVRLRGLMATHADLAQKLAELEERYDGQFRAVFDAIRQLMTPPEVPARKRIGFGVE